MSAKRSSAPVWLVVSLVLILLFAVSPLILASVSSGIASVLGCTVNEGGASGCILRGRDIGETLAEMFVAGWLEFVTLPLGLAALAVWFVAACVVTIIGWRRRRRAA
jgi:hypothetical protein